MRFHTYGTTLYDVSELVSINKTIQRNLCRRERKKQIKDTRKEIGMKKRNQKKELTTPKDIEEIQ